MKNKINISEIEKKEILDKHKNGISIRKLEKIYPYSFTFIQKLISTKNYENNLNKNYPNIKNKILFAVCKKTNKKFEDYSNKSGVILTHLKKIYPNIKIESNYIRKSIEYKTGKFWYDTFFYFKHENAPKIKKCKYCNWETHDINNLSGAYEKHLLNNHNKLLNEYIKEFPNEKKYFKKEIYENLIECKILVKVSNQ